MLELTAIQKGRLPQHKLRELLQKHGTETPPHALDLELPTGASLDYETRAVATHGETCEC